MNLSIQFCLKKVKPFQRQVGREADATRWAAVAPGAGSRCPSAWRRVSLRSSLRSSWRPWWRSGRGRPGGCSKWRSHRERGGRNTSRCPCWRAPDQAQHHISHFETAPESVKPFQKINFFTGIRPKEPRLRSRRHLRSQKHTFKRLKGVNSSVTWWSIWNDMNPPQGGAGSNHLWWWKPPHRLLLGGRKSGETPPVTAEDPLTSELEH